MSLVTTLKALAAAGGTAEQLLAVVEAHEAAQDVAAAERRTKAAAKKRRQRAMSPFVPGTEGDIGGQAGTNGDSPEGAAPAHVRSARVVIPLSSSLRSEEVGGGGGECAGATCDWPDGKASDHVRLLVEAVASPRLDPTKSPGLITTSGRLAAWKRDGASWEHDVVPVVTAVCAKQRSLVATWKFFDQAVGRSISDNREALSIPEASAPRATGPPNLMDRMAAEAAEARRRAFELIDARDAKHG